MTSRIFLAATAASAAFALAGCGGGHDSSNLNQVAAADQNAALPTIPAPNNGDWTQVVQETPDGGFRMGNPDAPVKLVEYASISCPHCAEFTEQASPPLRERYVRSGQVSWEYRPTMQSPTDPGVFQLLRRQGAAPFFSMVDQLYTNQRQWMTQVQSQAAMLDGLPPQQRVPAMVRAGGLDQFFRQRGMPAARVESCLADQNGLQQMLSKSSEAVRRDEVSGTPTFFINGEKIEGVGLWNTGNAAQSLEPRLRAAIGS